MDQFHGGATLVVFFPEPNSGLVAFAVYISHERDLMISFLKVRLVDADGIYPQCSRLTREFQVVESNAKILGDRQCTMWIDAIPDKDMVASFGRSPHIR